MIGMSMVASLMNVKEAERQYPVRMYKKEAMHLHTGKPAET